MPYKIPPKPLNPSKRTAPGRGRQHISDEELTNLVNLRQGFQSEYAMAKALGISSKTLNVQLRIAARRGLMGTKPVLPGFELSKTTTVTNEDGDVVREFVQQKPEHGEEFTVPEGHAIKGVSALVDANGQVIQQWVKTREDANNALEMLRITVDELKKDLPKLDPAPAPHHVQENLCNQYTLTDLHLGMMAWAEETGDADYDLKIAEALVIDWFSAAIQCAPPAHTGILAQLGDLMHHDSHDSVTPENRNILDADSRLQKIIRVVIRVVRRVIGMLLSKHTHVHVIMAAGNHDPASSAWIRELLFAMYENEPRITIDRSPSVYYAFEWGKTALFYHHGNKRKINDVDTVFAGRFREMYGRCIKSYGHIGHHHNDEAKDSNLMKVERHRTLAASDAYSATGGWLSDRDAKVITYHKEYGEVARITLSPDMVKRG